MPGARSTFREEKTCWLTIKLGGRTVDTEARIVKNTSAGVVGATPGSALNALGGDAMKWVAIVPLSEDAGPDTAVPVGFMLSPRDSVKLTVPRRISVYHEFAEGVPSTASLLKAHSLLGTALSSD